MLTSRISKSKAARAAAVAIALALVAMTMPPVANASRQGEQEFVVVKAGKVITAAGEEIERGEIVIVDGEISLVGVGLEYPKNAEVINARDQIVMPGFIDAHSRLGLRSLRRNGINAGATVAPELYLSEIDFEPMLSQGFIAAAYYPDGDGITGTSTVYLTAGEDDERMIRCAAYLLIDFTSQPRARNTLEGALRKAKSELKKVEKAREEWEKKKKEAEEEAKQEEEARKKEQEEKEGSDGEKKDAADDPEKKPEGEGEEAAGEFEPPPIDEDVRAIAELLEGKTRTPALIEFRRASDILHLDQTLGPYDDFAYRLLMLATAFTDLDHVVDTLGERDAFIAMVPQLSTYAQTTTYFNAAAELARSGCTIAFVPQFDAESAYEQFRTGAAELARTGMDREQAIEAMTIRPAELLGIADRLGSIEPGKQAHLTFFDTDPLAAGARVTRVMIAGHTVWEREDDTR